MRFHVALSLCRSTSHQGGQKMSRRRNESRYSRAWAQRECEASLQRLKTDCIDVYYLHRDYNGMDLEEPLRAIDQLLRAGKFVTGAFLTFVAGGLPRWCTWPVP
jgi:aryl-alcohol dehydrogenase-like predicted oxidoreductase